MFLTYSPYLRADERALSACFRCYRNCSNIDATMKKAKIMNMLTVMFTIRSYSFLFELSFSHIGYSSMSVSLEPVTRAQRICLTGCKSRLHSCTGR